MAETTSQRRWLRDWVDLSAELEHWQREFLQPLIERTFKVLARYDFGDWPTRDNQADEEC